MRIPSIISIPAASAVQPTAAMPTFSEPVPGASSPWTNPAAAAALRSSSDLLKLVEDGMVQNFRNPELVRSLAGDLKSTTDILRTAIKTISTDASPDNDAFLPLLDNAGESSQFAYVRLASKDLAAIWPVERADILAAVRRARAITSNVADQLDPRYSRPR